MVLMYPAAYVAAWPTRPGNFKAMPPLETPDFRGARTTWVEHCYRSYNDSALAGGKKKKKVGDTCGNESIFTKYHCAHSIMQRLVNARIIVIVDVRMIVRVPSNACGNLRFSNQRGRLHPVRVTVRHVSDARCRGQMTVRLRFFQFEHKHVLLKPLQGCVCNHMIDGFVMC
jgi:hypothetical protein